MQRVCSIFFYEGYVSLAPTIINFSKVLSEYGYCITILATRNSSDIPQPDEIENRVKILYLSKIIKSYQFFYRPLLRRLITLVNALEIAVFSLQSLAYLFQSDQQQEEVKNTINIGVDLNGSIAAFLSSLLFKQKFVFLSLELEQPREFGYIAKLFSKIANLAYRKSECVIVQDEDRFQTLCEYYQYRHPKVFYLPNSPLQSSSSATNTEDLFREKFSLSKENFPHIILSAGMIDDSVCSKSLAHAFASINNGCALVFHGVDKRGLNEETPYIQLLRQVNSNNLFLSLKPLPYDQIGKIYASATVGLAFYENINDNYTKIAKASGKLPQYLKHGKPVLVSDFPSLSRLIEKYQCGVVIKDPSNSREIELAIDKIINSYDTYSNNAKACFDAEFNFEQKMRPIISYVDNLQTVSGVLKFTNG